MRRRYLDEELKGQTLSEEMAHADHTLRTKKARRKREQLEGFRPAACGCLLS